MVPRVDRWDTGLIRDSETRGAPLAFVCRTSESTYELADELARHGCCASAQLVRRLLLRWATRSGHKAKGVLPDFPWVVNAR